MSVTKLKYVHWLPIIRTGEKRHRPNRPAKSVLLRAARGVALV